MLPLSTGEEVKMARRDLHDARFQVISQDTEGSDLACGSDQELQFLEAPSDLVPGVYEGGLKTWECSLDLAGYLQETEIGKNVRGKRVLEVRSTHFWIRCDTNIARKAGVRNCCPICISPTQSLWRTFVFRILNEKIGFPPSRLQRHGVPPCHVPEYFARLVYV